jgi:hypothetical protein
LMIGRKRSGYIGDLAMGEDECKVALRSGVDVGIKRSLEYRTRLAV